MLFPFLLTKIIKYIILFIEMEEIMHTLTETLRFYSWVDRCLFPLDFENDLIKLGMDKQTAKHTIKSLFHSNKLNIIKVYEHFKDDEKNLNILEKYLNKELEKYKEYSHEKRKKDC